MAKTLDFNTRKKEYLTVKLNDEKKTVLMIGTPTKTIMREFIAINEKVSEDGDTDPELIEDLYDVCAKVMSFNKMGVKISSDYLGDFFDVENILVFFEVYGDFMSSMTNTKN